MSDHLVSTPRRITADIRRLCRRIGGVDDLVVVPVRARPDSRTDDCFENVRRQADEAGGTIQHGWTIWEWPGIFVEGEFHAVWRNPSGDLIDVTHKVHGETSILFAPDPKRVFLERRVPNVRLAISRDPKVKQFFDLTDRFQKVMMEAMKDVPFGTSHVLQPEQIRIQEQILSLQIALARSRDSRRSEG